MQFWSMAPKSATSDTWVGLQDHSDLGEALNEKIARGGQPPTPISLGVRNRGKHVGDMLHATGNFINVASERFCDVLEEVGATGWMSVPVEIRYKNGEELPGYRLVVPTGRCDDFRIEREDIDDYVPIDSFPGWDGSDIFWHEATTMVLLVTDRVKVALEEAGMQRLEFERPRH